MTEIIPPSWSITPLENVCKILDSKRIPINAKERNTRIANKQSNELYPYYGATGVVGNIDGYIFDGEHLLLGEDGAPFLDHSKDTAYLASGKFWVNNHAHILKACISNKYLCHFLNQFDFSQSVTGTTRLKLNQSSLKEIPVYFAPKKEQHRIVAKIEELFSELDKGIESLKTAREQLKVYRQALLKHTFEGKLTEQWRKDNADKLETADQLLERIKKEREARYQQQLEEWKAAVKQWEAAGKEGKKPGKPRKYIPTVLDDEKKPELAKVPSGWLWLNFSELLYSIRGGTTTPPIDEVTNYPILRSSSVRSGVIDYGDIRYLTKEGIKSEQDFIAPGDLLFSRLNGTIDYVGNCAAVSSIFPDNMLYPDRLYCVKLVDKSLAPYCEYFFSSPAVRKHIEEKAKSTAGHKRISIPDVTDLLFKITGREEMDVIVSVLDEQISIIQQNHIDIETNLKKAEVLRQSILKKAFSGQLVPQDSNDEPASLLLERIASEKAEAAVMAKKAKAAKKKQAMRKAS